MVILENFSLKHLNTFRVEAKAAYYTEINYDSDLFELAQTITFHSKKRLVLGGGSNILFTKDFDGLVINMNLKGIKIVSTDDKTITLEAAAGVIWHDLVKTCLKSNYYGLENLALIPGKVGAAPVQNIGAYGIEQQDLLVEVKVFDFKSNKIIRLSKEECKFGYRDSVFKHELKDKAIVTSVVYKLSRKFFINDSYKALRNELEKFSFVKPDSRYIFDTICRIRNSKLPDIDKIGSGGSFFKNPVINQEQALRLSKSFSEMPAYPTREGNYKLSAAWLIDQCGLKGKRSGDAGVCDKHALVLVNYGNASGKDIFLLAKNIIRQVLKKFEIELETEVLIY
jgi:UDP-N-acetylmuramate dehydrogenase